MTSRFANALSPRVIFVFKSIRTYGQAVRLSLLPIVLLSITTAQAQTAPQLLPYTSRLIAGGGSATIASGATCPVSGLTSTDAYGDGCLATEIQIGNVATGASTPGARAAVADANGNVFFTDYQNALVRRVDAITGIVTAVAGGAASSPASGTTCGTGVSTDAAGDGCLGTLVKLSHPASLVFAPNGDLYFGDAGAGQVRKITATAGFITTTGTISLVVGNASGTFGYGASNASTTVTIGSAASYLRAPYGLAFDTKGDLFIVDEYTEAIIVANTNATGTNIVNGGVSVPAGTIWKIAGTTTPGTVTYCTNGTATGYGCNYGLYTENSQANASEFDSTYSVAVGPDGTVYAGDEYYDSVFQVSPATFNPNGTLLSAGGILSTYAGIQNSVGVKPTIARRAKAGSFGVGSVFGIAADTSSNVYFTDSSSGVIWRVDGAGLSNYVVAGGATTACAAAIDAYGDGCPATQAIFGKSGTGNYASATLPGPGIYAVSVDGYSDLFTGDTETNLVREVASGTSFGTVSNTTTVDTIDVHFAAGDTYANSGAYTLTAGATNFSIGTPVLPCTTNSDNTTDCLVPIRATPTALGKFTGTLQVVSAMGAKASFPLLGYLVQTPVTSTQVIYAASVTCSGTTTYSTSTAINITANVNTAGASIPGGTVTFYANNGTTTTPIGTIQQLTNLGTTSAPSYGATLSYTFSTPGTYTLSAIYSGDPYYKSSTGTDTTKIISATPTFTTTPLSTMQSTISAGQTGLYSFTINQSVYTGTLSFACSGLPANSSCGFSPSTIIGAGCSTSNTVAFSILTQQGQPVAASLISGSGPWGIVSLIGVVSMALLLGLRRRLVLRHTGLWLTLALLLASSGLMACGKGSTVVAATPSGAYTITVTTSGTTGTPSVFTVPLTVK
jgi:hypothetical protein